MSEQGPHSVLESILPSSALQHAPGATPLTVFKPWHLPRKQQLRKKQWIETARGLLDENADRKLIKYLCLPGEDLLDIQSLAELCKEKKRQLRYLGFDSSSNPRERSTQRILAEQIVQQTGVIEQPSVILPDDFSSILHRKSIGSRHVREGGSYDIVNLDMCDAFTSHHWAPIHQAVRELLSIQTFRRAEPWLLFITTRSEVARLQRTEIDAYASSILRNASRSTEFREGMIAIASVENPENDVRVLVDAIRSATESDTFLAGRWLTLGIGKWLLGVMGSVEGEQWRVSLLSVYAYRTGLLGEEGVSYAGETPNLFSLAFRFDKIRRERQDPSGMTVPRGDATYVFDEVRLAEKLMRCVRNHTLDLDKYMQQEQELRDRSLDECRAQLKARYYSDDAYCDWVKRLPAIP